MAISRRTGIGVGVKLTIVIDTEDHAGLRDTYKIVNHFYKRISPRPRAHANDVSFGKIEFIKMLRAFAKDAKIAEETGDDSTSLRFTKQYADVVFNKNKETL